MRIVLATPLYPPDTAEPAPYIKELAKRLAGRHQVTIVAYGRLPEKIPGVSIVAIDKRQPLPKRLLAYYRALAKAAREADIVYAENGASVELPTTLVGLRTGTPIVLHVGDAAAHEHANKSWSFHMLERIAKSHAKSVVTDSPLPRPEIIPFEAAPTAAQEAYEVSWQKHVALIESIFTHAN